MQVEDTKRRNCIEWNESTINGEFVSGIIAVPAKATITLKPPVNFEIDRPFFYSIIRIEDQIADTGLMSLFQGHITAP